ncbi:MAG: hypothetical protein ABIH23_32505 [bacterium]
MSRMIPARIVAWIPVVGFLSGVLCVAQPLIAFERLDVRRIDGRAVGFDVLSPEGFLAASIRFSANGVFWPQTIEQTSLNSRLTLRFSRFQCEEISGLRLSDNSSISVVWDQGAEFPEIHFTIVVENFDAEVWEQSQGRIPFHFLICSLPEAEVFHQRGWLIATPLADPFPLQQAPHAGHPEIRSAWSEDWSYAPALGCHPIPVLGLWAAHHNQYVAYDFSETRFLDNSEKEIGTVYCWRYKSYRQFVTLTFPASAESVDQLVYPKAGDGIQSHFRLVWSRNLPPTKDPNRFLIERLAAEAPEAIPTMKGVNDLDYMPGPTRLKSFTEPQPQRIIGPGGETRFYREGTVLIHGWKSHIGSWVDRVFDLGRSGQIATLREQAQELLRSAKRFRVDGDRCVYWEKPIRGSWVPEFGGEAATTLHNSDGFAAARVLLNLWKHDEKPEYLEAAEGALNWARHIVWTRNEFADVPSAPFAIGGSLPIAFLLDYYHLFRDDIERTGSAHEALDLAVTFAYRYLPVWLYDNNRDDTIDSTFLLEPNAGRDWTGAACANEVTWQIEAAAEVMLTTGDPALKKILQGILERWPLLYRDEYQASVADYNSSFTECFGLYPGCAVGAGNRAGYGWAEPFHLLYPVGTTKARVLCGEGTCFVTNRGGRHTRVEDYRTNGRSSFSFTLTSALNGPFDLSISIPRMDVKSLPVKKKRRNKTTLLTLGTDYIHASERLDSLIVTGVQDGDRIIIGSDLRGKKKKTEEADVEVELPASVGPFNILCTKKLRPLDCDWFDLDSSAGLFTGLQYACGVPFHVGSNEWGNPLAWSLPVAIQRSERRNDLFVFWIPDGPEDELVVVRSHGESEHIRVTDCAPVRRGWPPIFEWRLLAAYLPGDKHRPIKRIEVLNGNLVALTSIPREMTGKSVILNRLEKARLEWDAESAFEKDLKNLIEQTAGTDFPRMAVMPAPSMEGLMARLAFETRSLNKARCLRPHEMCDASILNPEQYPVLLVAGAEDYIHTVNREGDAKQVLLDYCRSGGTLFIMGPGPFPMFYAAGLDGKPIEPFLPQVGVPIIGIEDNRSAMGWMIHRQEGTGLFERLPSRFRFPSGGDRRLRPIDRRQISDYCSYRPLLSVYDEDGTLLGDAAARLTFTDGPQRGFRVFYIWGPLLKHPDYGNDLVLDVFFELNKMMEF